MASRCIGAGHLAFLRGGPAAGRAALAPIHAAGAASFPPSSPAIFPGSAAPVALALAVLVAKMPHSLLLAYCVLGVLSLFYLGLVHLPSRARGRSLPYFPKELVIALLFAAASALPAWDEARRRAAGMPRHHPLLLLCPLFAVLCWLNCVAIEDWEHHRRGIAYARSPGWQLRPVASACPPSRVPRRAGWPLLPPSAAPSFWSSIVRD